MPSDSPLGSHIGTVGWGRKSAWVCMATSSPEQGAVAGPGGEATQKKPDHRFPSETHADFFFF